MGLRYFVGCDYNGYGIRFFQTENATLGEVLSRGEAGFEMLTYLGFHLLKQYNLFLLACSTIIAFLYVKFAKGHDEASFIAALFFPILVVQLGMSGVRQAIAVGLVALAYNEFIHVKRTKCAMLILLAGLFHSSAFILLPLSLMAGRSFSVKRVLIGVALLVLPASFLIGGRIDIYQDRYIDQIYGSQESGGAWIRYLLTLLPIPLFLLRRNFIKRNFPQQYNLLLLASIICFASFLVGLISSVALHRLLYYFMPLSILIAAYTLDAFSSKLEGKMAWLCIYAGYFFAWFLTSRHADVCYTPYQNTTFFNTIAPDWFVGF